MVLALMVGGCIPRTTPPPGYGRGAGDHARRPATARPAPFTPIPTDAKRQRRYGICLADLSRAGAQVEPLPDRVFPNGCSAVAAVKLVAIGIPVTNLGAMTCALAEPFTAWVRGAVQPAAQRRLGTTVARIESFGTFACRPINNQAGNALSEHGRANAVDVAAFVLADGRRITVKDDWRNGDAGAFLHDLHDDACRRFAVVLGPDANALHHDHLHFDMGSGRLCR
jgi:hypothetical protein